MSSPYATFWDGRSHRALVLLLLACPLLWLSSSTFRFALTRACILDGTLDVRERTFVPDDADLVEPSSRLAAAIARWEAP